MQKECISTLNIHGTPWEPLWKYVHFSLKKVLFVKDWRDGKRNVFILFLVFAKTFWSLMPTYQQSAMEDQNLVVRGKNNKDVCFDSFFMENTFCHFKENTQLVTHKYENFASSWEGLQLG